MLLRQAPQVGGPWETHCVPCLRCPQRSWSRLWCQREVPRWGAAHGLRCCSLLPGWVSLIPGRGCGQHCAERGGALELRFLFCEPRGLVLLPSFPWVPPASLPLPSSSPSPAGGPHTPHLKMLPLPLLLSLLWAGEWAEGGARRGGGLPLTLDSPQGPWLRTQNSGCKCRRP